MFLQKTDMYNFEKKRYSLKMVIPHKSSEWKKIVCLLTLFAGSVTLLANTCAECDTTFWPKEGENGRICQKCLGGRWIRDLMEEHERRKRVNEERERRQIENEEDAIKRAIKKHVYGDPTYRRFRKKKGYGNERVEISTDSINVTRCFRYNDGTPGAEASFEYDGAEHKLKLEKHSSVWKISTLLVDGKDVRRSLLE